MIFNINLYSKNLYNFFIFLSLIIFFFSTAKVQGKAFEISDIEISTPFEINFNKNKVIDSGFKKAFLELLSTIVKSDDKNKIGKTKLNEIKGMINSFSIKEEKFIDEIYYLNLGVSFNKKEVFKYLGSKNIYPSIPIKNKFLFIPIIIDENNKDLLIFNNNKVFDEWNNFSESFHLIEYILPTADLEDLNLIKKNFQFIEQYDFKEITEKYNLKDSIISLIFKNDNQVRVLSRITVNKEVFLKNQTFSNLNISNQDNIETLIKNLKMIYEDYWKNSNQINTGIKLSLNIKINSSNNLKISKFEKTLNEMDLVNDFRISKFDKDFVFFKIIFNGTPSNFLKSMSEKSYIFDTQKNFWVLK